MFPYAAKYNPVQKRLEALVLGDSLKICIAYVLLPPISVVSVWGTIANSFPTNNEKGGGGIYRFDFIFLTVNWSYCRLITSFSRVSQPFHFYFERDYSPLHLLRIQ